LPSWDSTRDEAAAEALSRLHVLPTMSYGSEMTGMRNILRHSNTSHISLLYSRLIVHGVGSPLLVVALDTKVLTLAII
jgi:hypothetical protein